MTISFILAVYQIERYIEDCINSILPSLADGDQLIIVNDGSTDRSSEIAKRITANHPNTLIIDKPNGGLSSARNKGLSAATCDYVLFIDGDDVVISEAIKMARTKLDKYSPDILVTDYYEWLSDGHGEKRLSRQRSHAKNQLTSNPAMHLLETLEDCIPCVWTRFFRRTLFDSLGNMPFPEWCMYDDLPTTPRLVSHAETMYYLPIPTVLYRTRAGSITKIRNNRSCTDMLKAALWACDATMRFPGNPALQQTGRAFLARKWLDAVKQSREIPKQSWGLQAELLSIVKEHLLTAKKSDLLHILKSERKSDAKVRRHLVFARKSQWLYILYALFIAWFKGSRPKQTNNPLYHK